MASKFKFLTLLTALILTLCWCFCGKKSTGPEVGSIFADSTPEGAKIFLDGNDTKLITPSTIQSVPTGNHTLKLTLLDYVDWTQGVTVRKNQTTSVYATLSLGVGRIYISSTPHGASIQLDEEETGKVTPDTLKEVTPGSHEVKLRHAGCYVWTDTVVVHADQVTVVSAELVAGSKIFVGGDRGIIVSDDGGVTWQSSDAGISGSYEATCMLIDQSKPQIMYAGMNMAGAPVFKSTDGGKNWHSSGIGFPHPYVRVSDLAMDCTDHNILYFSVQNYEESGVDWAQGLIYRSTNAGNLWVKATTGLPVSDGFHPCVYSIASDPVNTGMAYAGLETSWGGPSAIFKTTNAGISWFALGKCPGEVRSIALDPHDPGYIYAGTTGGLYMSPDAGLNWNHFYTSEDFWSVTVDQASVIYAGTVGAVYRSDNRGTSWTRYTNGLPSDRLIWALAVDPLSPDRVFAVAYNTSSIYVSADGGAHWEERKLKYYYTETLPALSIALSPE